MNYFISLLLIAFSFFANASGTLSTEQIDAVNKADLEAEKLSVVAGYLAQYEIQAKKLINDLDSTDLVTLNNQTTELMNLSMSVISSARFRLPQCDAYLNKTLDLTHSINTITLEALERDYHHDGLLPKAPAECYHTKDLFVHPATVLVHTRLNPSLQKQTKSAIKGEIAEVLTHLDLVRQLVVY